MESLAATKFGSTPLQVDPGSDQDGPCPSNRDPNLGKFFTRKMNVLGSIWWSFQLQNLRFPMV